MAGTEELLELLARRGSREEITTGWFHLRRQQQCQHDVRHCTWSYTSASLVPGPHVLAAPGTAAPGWQEGTQQHAAGPMPEMPSYRGAWQLDRGQ
jgi:hypothetical protein